MEVDPSGPLRQTLDVLRSEMAVVSSAGFDADRDMDLRLVDVGQGVWNTPVPIPRSFPEVLELQDPLIPSRPELPPRATAGWAQDWGPFLAGAAAVVFGWFGAACPTGPWVPSGRKGAGVSAACSRVGSTFVAVTALILCLVSGRGLDGGVLACTLAVAVLVYSPTAYTRGAVVAAAQVVALVAGAVVCAGIHSRAMAEFDHAASTPVYDICVREARARWEAECLPQRNRQVPDFFAAWCFNPQVTACQSRHEQTDLRWSTEQEAFGALVAVCACAAAAAVALVAALWYTAAAVNTSKAPIPPPGISGRVVLSPVADFPMTQPEPRKAPWSTSPTAAMRSVFSGPQWGMAEASPAPGLEGGLGMSESPSRGRQLAAGLSAALHALDPRRGSEVCGFSSGAAQADMDRGTAVQHGSQQVEEGEQAPHGAVGIGPPVAGTGDMVKLVSAGDAWPWEAPAQP